MRENPAWATHAIADSLEFLEARVPPEWLPKLTKVAPAPRGRMSAAMKEYGCGAYGCVLPTLDVDTVLKVTTDQSEADFASGMAGELVAPIVVEYRMVISLSKRYDGQPIWLLWRESAEHVGGLLEVLGEREGHEAELAVHEQHEAAQRILQHMAQHPTRAPSLVAYKDALHRMRKIPAVSELARGMLDVLEKQNILIGDVHGGNLGMVGDQWKIIDPGHVVVLGETKVYRTNPTVDGFSFSRIEAPLLRDTQSGRMLRLLWDRGRMTQAEFMKRSSHIAGDPEAPLRPGRGTGLSSFANNYHHFTKPYPVYRMRPQPQGETLGKVAKFVAPIRRRTVTDADIADGFAKDKRSIMLEWAGPTPDEWLAALSDAELKKAGARLREAVLDDGNEVDLKWVARLRDETWRRTGGSVAFDQWFDARSDVELERLFTMTDRLVGSGDANVDSLLVDIRDAMRRKGLGIGDHRRIKRNPAATWEQAEQRATSLLMDRSPSAMTILSDMVEERGETIESFLYQLSTHLSEREGGHAEMPDTVEDFERGVFPPLAPPLGDFTGRWGLLEKVAVQWQLRGHQRHNHKGLWWSPRLEIIAPFHVDAREKPPSWSGPFFIMVHMPGKSWMIHPRNPRRLDYGVAKDVLMTACWYAINFLRPEEWDGYRVSGRGEYDPTHGTPSALPFLDRLIHTLGAVALD